MVGVCLSSCQCKVSQVDVLFLKAQLIVGSASESKSKLFAESVDTLFRSFVSSELLMFL